MSLWKLVPIWVAVFMIGWCIVPNAIEGDWVTFGCLLFICFALFWAQELAVYYGGKR